MDESLRTQHLKAIAAIHDLMHTDLSVQLESYSADKLTKTVSFICKGSSIYKVLEVELRALQEPLDLFTSKELLSNVRVYTSGE